MMLRSRTFSNCRTKNVTNATMPFPGPVLRALEKCRSGFLDGNFPDAFLIIILRAIHARTHGILIHQAGIKRL